MTVASEHPSRILLVEDDLAFAELLTFTLERSGFAVHAVTSTREARWLLRDGDGPFDVIVSDIRLPRGSGVDLLASPEMLERGTPLILMTAFPTTELRAAVAKAGGELLEKPFPLETLCERIRQRVGRAAP